MEVMDHFRVGHTVLYWWQMDWSKSMLIIIIQTDTDQAYVRYTHFLSYNISRIIALSNIWNAGVVRYVSGTSH